jgi:hypothetical protein
VKFLFPAILLFLFVGLKPALVFAAPLESGFALAPRPSASQEEKIRAYSQARQSVVEAARKYEGTPYVYGGLSARGVDCSGFIVLAFRDALGVTLPRSAAGLYSWSERIPYERAQSGDLLFFRTDNTRRITHVGLYLGSRRFIHAASAGSKTGVIYSSLDEQYWSRAFAGAGRAIPEGVPGINVETGTSIADTSPPNRQETRQVNTTNDNLTLHLNAAFAPTLDLFFLNESVIRGFTSQIGVYTPLGSQFGLGLELRPELDRTLRVFRLPLTISLGVGNEFTFFAGPVLSIGRAAINVDGSQRKYYGGTSMFGIAGVTYAPQIFKTAKRSELAPYFEVAWQSYSANNTNFRFFADTSASFRMSAGIRWRMEI